MASVQEFVASPSESFLECCTKEQLFEIADYYKIDIGDKRRKIETIKTILIANLEDSEVLSVKKMKISGNCRYRVKNLILCLNSKEN